MLSARGKILLVASGVAWGLTFPAIKLALNDLSVFQFIFVRFSLALPLMVVISRPKLTRLSILTGFVSLVALALQVGGMKFTTATNSGFITGMYAVFTPMVAFFLLRSKPSRRDVISLSLSMVGLALLTNLTMNLNLGDLLTLISAFLWAVQIVLVTMCTKDSDPMSIAFAQSVVMAAGSAPLAALDSVPRFSIVSAGAVVYTAVFGTVFGLWAQAEGQRYVPPEVAAIAYLVEPVVAAVSSAAILGERLSPQGILGAILILVGIALASL